MTLRVATPDDAAAIANLEAVCMPVPWSVDAVRRTLSAATTRAWVLTLNRQTVGYLLTSQVAGEGEVFTVGVHPDHRRQGHGRVLITALITHWRAVGVTTGFLDVRDDNEAARRLYQALGFQAVGRRPGMYTDGTDAVLMRWTE